jgi:hypothetical protein
VWGQTSGIDDQNRLGSKTGSVTANQRDPFVERGLRDDHEKRGKANVPDVTVMAEMLSAEDRLPETAESVAAERD